MVAFPLQLLFLDLFVSAIVEYPKTVWSWYDRDDEPRIKLFYEFNSNRLRNRYQYYFLTMSNLSSFLNISSFPREFYHIGKKKQSDYIRLCLLSKYGGWWIDSSTLIANPNYLDDIIQQVKETGSVAFGYGYSTRAFSSIQAGVMYAPTGSLFYACWKEELEKALQEGQENYIIKALYDGVRLNSVMFRKYPILNTYHIVGAAMQVSFQRRIQRNFSIVTAAAETGMYSLLASCNWKPDCFKQKVLDEFSNPQFNITKLPGYIRGIIWPDIVQREAWTEAHPRKHTHNQQGSLPIVRNRYIWLSFIILVVIVLCVSLSSKEIKNAV